MASDNTIRAFSDLKEIYMNQIAPEELTEAKLKGNQHKLDVNGNKRIDAGDFALLRSTKKRIEDGVSPLFKYFDNNETPGSRASLKIILNTANELGGDRSYRNESYSNWREENPEIFEAVKNDETVKQEEIKVNPKIKNNINTSPSIQEALSEYDVEVLSSDELDEEYFQEAASIATEYFYECGLNENGVEELIESIGEQKFIDFVFDLMEDYELNEENLLEWRRGPNGSKIRGNQTTKSGKHFKDVKGGAKTTARRATPEAKRREEEKNAPSTGSKIGSELSRLSDRSKDLRKNTVNNKTQEITKKPESSSTSNETKPNMKKNILGHLALSADTAAKVAARRGAEAKAVYDTARRIGKRAENSPQAKQARETLGRAASTAKKVAGKVAMAAVGAAGAGAGSLASGKSLAGAAGRAAGTFVRRLRKEEVELQEKSESQSQQQLFGLALSVKRGEAPRSKASKEVLDIVDSMSEGEIRKFAKTKHKGLPQHVKEELLVNKILRIVRETK